MRKVSATCSLTWQGKNRQQARRGKSSAQGKGPRGSAPGCGVSCPGRNPTACMLRQMSHEGRTAQSADLQVAGWEATMCSAPFWAEKGVSAACSKQLKLTAMHERARLRCSFGAAYDYSSCPIDCIRGVRALGGSTSGDGCRGLFLGWMPDGVNFSWKTQQNECVATFQVRNEWIYRSPVPRPACAACPKLCRSPDRHAGTYVQ